jgi:hypothetical protein
MTLWFGFSVLESLDFTLLDLLGIQKVTRNKGEFGLQPAYAVADRTQQGAGCRERALGLRLNAH